MARAVTALKCPASGRSGQRHEFEENHGEKRMRAFNSMQPVKAWKVLRVAMMLKTPIFFWM